MLLCGFGVLGDLGGLFFQGWHALKKIASSVFLLCKTLQKKLLKLGEVHCKGFRGSFPPPNK